MGNAFGDKGIKEVAAIGKGTASYGSQRLRQLDDGEKFTAGIGPVRNFGDDMRHSD